MTRGICYWRIETHNAERARRHWAIARAFVQVYLVRPYALFWHEYAGKQLFALADDFSEL
jgi:hypothetical protein